MLDQRSLPSDKLIACFYDSSDDCVKVIDVDGVLLSVNPGGLVQMEIDNVKDIVGKDWLAVWRGDMAAKATEAFEKSVQGSVSHFEGYCPTAKGTPKWWSVSIAPLKNEYNKVQWILAISRDITELHSLREENKLLKNQVKTLAS